MKGPPLDRAAAVLSSLLQSKPVAASLSPHELIQKKTRELKHPVIHPHDLEKHEMFEESKKRRGTHDFLEWVAYFVGIS